MSLKNYSIKTFGCQMNFSDSERIESVLESMGYRKIFWEKKQVEGKKKDNLEEKNRVDLMVFNSCGVRQTAENRLIGQIRNFRLKNKDAFMIVTGCLAENKNLIKKLSEKVNLFLPIKEITHLPEILNEFITPDQKNKNNFATVSKSNLLNSEKKTITYLPEVLNETKNYKLKTENYFDIPPIYQLTESISVPIMTGCNNFCSYCVVPYARGREESRLPLEIVKEIMLAKQKNPDLKEVLLLGQNVNSYKIDQNTDFPNLLSNLAELFLELGFRFLTSHPKDFSLELIDVIKNHANISRQIHLPIQSGSDKILAAMNRHYTAKNYLEIINKIKAVIPEVQISTDVIVGYPGETEEDFDETVEVFKKVGFFEAYINKYSPRIGTAAFSLGDPIPWQIKKQRAKILQDLVRS